MANYRRAAQRRLGMSGPKPLPHEGRNPQGIPREGRTSRGYITDYSRPSRQQEDRASRWIARDNARRQHSIKSSFSYRNGNWFDNNSNQLIGHSRGENSPISRVKPRRLGNPRYR